MRKDSVCFLQEKIDMRVIFIGSIEFSWHCLAEILEKKLANVVGIFNVLPKYNKDISDYRDQKDLAQTYHSPHFWFKNINDSKTVLSIKKLTPDLILLFGLSQIVKKEILEIPRIGILGTHPTLLPKNRGRAPIPWSILKGLKKSGLTFFYLDQSADTGDIVDQMSWKITGRNDATSLYRKMTFAGKKMLVRTLPKIAKGIERRTPQPQKSNYWPARKPSDGKISWNKSYLRVDRLIRATTKPYPGAFCFWNGYKIIIWKSKPLDNNLSFKVGTVIRLKKEGFLVKASRGIVKVQDWEPKSLAIAEGDILR
ncbi:MAG: Methionyl-tRNA formyltransferase [Parcubacteria group bacterium GW2011_GWA1_36_12]|nr:MAG: Methionyl-tRNA formyltransferase [Parcubacteria group bacterium GW2011_GWA1_36_12]